MTPTAQLIVVVLAAVLVGAVVPALYQLWKLLKTTNETLQSLTPRIHESLDRVNGTLERVNRVVDDVERGVKRMSVVAEAVGTVGDALSSVKNSLGSVVSIGSLVGGAVLSLFGGGSKRERREAAPAEPVVVEDDVPRGV